MATSSWGKWIPWLFHDSFDVTFSWPNCLRIWSMNDANRSVMEVKMFFGLSPKTQYYSSSLFMASPWLQNYCTVWQTWRVNLQCHDFSRIQESYTEMKRIMWKFLPLSGSWWWLILPSVSKNCKDNEEQIFLHEAFCFTAHCLWYLLYTLQWSHRSVNLMLSNSSKNTHKIHNLSLKNAKAAKTKADLF